MRAPTNLPSNVPNRAIAHETFEHHGNGANVKRDAVKLDTRLDVQVAPQAIRFALNVTNAGAKHVELNFRNGQSYDFVVVDSAGRQLWHWAAGRMFTQTVRNKQLSKGESMRMEQKWADSIAPGRYTAIATLTSSNYPVEQRAEFVVPTPVSIATR